MISSKGVKTFAITYGLLLVVFLPILISVISSPYPAWFRYYATIATGLCGVCLGREIERFVQTYVVKR